MTASEPLEVYETEQSACSYIVEEPTEHSADGLSELSPSVDTDTPVRYTMQEMEAYIQLVRKDREQVQQEVQHLQEGVDSLFQAMKKPAAQVEKILEDQTKTSAMVEEIEKFKQKVSKSLSMLTVKCEMLDKHVPELKEKLEHAIYTINNAQESMNAANQHSPAPSERSTSIGDFRFGGVSAEEVRHLHEKARHTDNQTKKRDQEFKSGMMELHAIRARLQEGIERNGNCDMKEVSRVSTTRELKVVLQAHARGELDGRPKDATCSLDLLAQYLREAVDRAMFSSASPEPFVDAAPRLIRTQSPEVGQKGKGSQLREGAKLREGVKLRDSANGTATTNGAVRSRTPKSHQVRLSCDETSPARSLSRGSSTGSRARSLDYSKNSGTGTARPGTARRPVPRYETRSRVDTGRGVVNGTPHRNSAGGGSLGGGTRRSIGSSLPRKGGSVGRDNSPLSEASMPNAPSRHTFAVSASPSRSTTSLAPPSRASAMTRASIDRLSQPKVGSRHARLSKVGGFKGDLSASTSSIPRQSVDRGRSASLKADKRPGSRGQGVRTSSQASTTCLSQEPPSTDEMAESSMCDSMASGHVIDEAHSMPLTMQPASTTALAAQYGDPAAALDAAAQGSAHPSGARGCASLRTSETENGSNLLQGMPMSVPEITDRNSPSISNDHSLSSAHSVPNPQLLSPSDKRRDHAANGMPPLADGLPALFTSLDSPDVTSARSPGAQQVRSMRQAISESQDRSLWHVADSVDHGREPAAPFQEPTEPYESQLGSTSQLESLHLDLDGVRDGRDVDDQEHGDNPVRSVRAWLNSGSEAGSEGDLVGGTGSITGSVIGCGLPNGLPVGISPRGLPNGLPRTGTSPLSSHRSPQKSSPHTSDPSPRNERPSPRTLSWDVDQPLNAAALVPGDGNLAHSHDPLAASDDAHKAAYGGLVPGSSDRRHSLRRLAPVVEEPGSSASVGTSGDVFGSWRASASKPMQSSAEWLNRQVSLKENSNGNMAHLSPASKQKMRSFQSGHSAMDSHVRQYQTRGFSDYIHDQFSIDSKDSCKPERCESPAKPQRNSGQRNGQGTDPPPMYQNSQLEQRIAQLVNRK